MRIVRWKANCGKPWTKFAHKPGIFIRMTELQLPHGIIELTVTFYDVDSMDIVWHGHYLKYFEDARCCLLDEIGRASCRERVEVWGVDAGMVEKRGEPW